MACNNLCVSENATFSKVLWIALLANFLMFIIEIVASYIGDSVSLQADALDFFGDTANYAISLFVLGKALHLRARAAMIKGLTMGVFGVWVLGSAFQRAYIGSEPEANIIGSVAIMALVVNLSVAVLLYKYRDGDSNMRSVWLCTRNDVIGNLMVLIAAVSVALTASRWPDLIVAVIIAFLSLSASYQVLRQSLNEMNQVKLNQ